METRVRPSISPIPCRRSAPPIWLRDRQISALFRRPPMPAFRGLPSCPGSPSLRAGRCAPSFWSARSRWTRFASVALDTSSLTSVALTKVLFAKWWGPGRTFTPMEPNIEKMMEGHDAGLVIGDPALKSRSLAISDLRPGRRMDSTDRQAFCVRLLGGAAVSVEGCSRGPRSGGSVSGLARPRFAAGES